MGRTKREPVMVALGQIWADNHPLRKGRKVRVIEVGQTYALVDPWDPVYSPYSYYSRRSTVVIMPTNILIRRLLQSGAYRFTGEVVDVPGDVFKGGMTALLPGESSEAP